jgi:hypothetical protein
MELWIGRDRFHEYTNSGSCYAISFFDACLEGESDAAADATGSLD